MQLSHQLKKIYDRQFNFELTMFVVISVNAGRQNNFKIPKEAFPLHFVIQFK